MSMAAARRHLLSLSLPRRQPYPHLLRRLSSSSDTPPSDQTPPPSAIPTVSYAVKPKPPPPETTPADGESLHQTEFTREDIRYMKNMPQLSSVSYPKKVAPLPEDRVAEEGGDELEGERRRIESDTRAIRRVFRVSEKNEAEELPFPTLIKVDKKSSERAVFDLQDVIRRVKASAKRNFDETLEAHVNLGIDRRRSDLGVSGAVVLPHGTGKNVRVAVFAEGAAADEAKAAGADVVGGDELIEEIKTSGKINFDKCIATHSMMQRVTKIGRILRGLTPNAKKGTVTNNVGGAVQEAKQGLLDFRMKDAIVHVGLGKVSFTEEALQENVGAFVNALLLAKPAGLKKTSKYAGYVNSFHLCSTMGPGFAVSIQSLSRAADLYTKLHPK
ncbi:hypothetical protein RND81_02G052500 [Saponaria officinalis]|uniref:Large ribosomal subunit protein uL1c n=1 Tax=Saponaria officinalis TaxID=3572 RepID=A0AAW1MR86_SAPOF